MYLYAGEVTADVPSIADLLQSEGETDTLQPQQDDETNHMQIKHVPGEITSGVPSLADLLQSEGETDQLLGVSDNLGEDQGSLLMGNNVKRANFKGRTLSYFRIFPRRFAHIARSAGVTISLNCVHSHASSKTPRKHTEAQYAQEGSRKFADAPWPGHSVGMLCSLPSDLNTLYMLQILKASCHDCIIVAENGQSVDSQEGLDGPNAYEHTGKLPTLPQVMQCAILWDIILQRSLLACGTLPDWFLANEAILWLHTSMQWQCFQSPGRVKIMPIQMKLKSDERNYYYCVKLFCEWRFQFILDLMCVALHLYLPLVSSMVGFLQWVAHWITAQEEEPDSPDLLAESPQEAGPKDDSNQINKWGFAPGEDDTQDLNLEKKGIFLYCDMRSLQLTKVQLQAI